MSEPNCRWAGRGNPRTFKDHHEDGCADEACDGCLMCLEPHCTVCGVKHAHSACPGCVGDTRETLREILRHTLSLPLEAEVKGVESEAAMLAGPAADPEAWRNRAMSAMMGRLHAGYLDDCRDEQHPLWVLGTWEQTWRDHLEHDTDERVTVALAAAYLDTQMTYMGNQIEPPFDEFARELRGCLAYVEDVLTDGVREERGAPCPACGMGALVHDYGRAVDGSADRWVCKRRACGQWWTEEDYRAKVEGTYVQVAEKLTASQIKATYRVTEGKVRKWAERGKVRKRGRDQMGRMLYDVADVLKARDSDVAA